MKNCPDGCPLCLEDDREEVPLREDEEDSYSGDDTDDDSLEDSNEDAVK